MVLGSSKFPPVLLLLLPVLTSFCIGADVEASCNCVPKLDDEQAKEGVEDVTRALVV